MLFFSVLNPAETCSYISEVLDAGLLGPLFKVWSLEYEVFHYYYYFFSEVLVGLLSVLV